MTEENEAQRSKDEIGDQEYSEYKKAIDFYQKALNVLGGRKAQPLIWDSVAWEFSGTLYTLGSQLQDHAPLSLKSKTDIEKQIIDAFMKALKYCDLETRNSPRLSLYQYRAAAIHHRLASMYHNTLRNDPNVEESKQGYLKQLSFSHYGKAINLYNILDVQQAFNDYLRASLERISLSELYLEHQISNKQKQIWSIIENFAEISEKIRQFSDETSNSDEPEVSGDERSNLLNLLVTRLQTNLLSTIKFLNSKSSKSKSKMADALRISKEIYANSIKIEKSNKDAKTFVSEIHRAMNPLPSLISKLK